MARTDRMTVELRAGPFGEAALAVTAVSGREALSQPFVFDVELHLADRGAVELADVVGAEAHLTLARPGLPERHVDGIVGAIELAGVSNGQPRYRLRLVPKLAELALRRGRRIFQALTAPEVVAQLLDEGKVAHRLSLSGSYPARTYCVQYDESDFELVTRLLAEEGIAYFFEHDGGGHVLVLADAAGACAPIAGDAKVAYRSSDRGSHDAAEQIERLEAVRQVEVGLATVADHDFERPALQLRSTVSQGGGAAGPEAYRYPGGFSDPAEGKRLARTRLEAPRREAVRVQGAGTCARLVPGATFEVVDHPDQALDRSLLVVAVEHQARQQEGAGEAGRIEHGYRCTFQAQDAGAPLRPPPRVARPRAWTETATVVGPAGEELHVDRHGRIRVQFHWDRQGHRDEHATCWLRCAQRWAGPGWGASFVPRIGQEVVVRYLEGDPDQPLVVGAVYNGQNPPPVTLPLERTRSTLRSDSSLGHQGFNELRYEDRADAEEVYLHAQRDEEIAVENDKTQRVGVSEALTVGKDRTRSIRGAQAEEVGGDDMIGIGAGRTLAVAGERQTQAGGSHAETVGLFQSVLVGASRTVTVGLGAAETVGAAAALTVGGAYAVTVGGAINVAVGGTLDVQVGGDSLEAVGGARLATIGGNASSQTAGDLAEEVGGRVGRSTNADQTDTVDGDVEVEIDKGVVGTSKEIVLEADSLTIVVGGNRALAIDKSGNVTFGAGKMTVDGDQITLKGSKIQQGGQASAESDSPAVTRLEPLPGEKAFVEIELKDQEGEPVPNAWFKVEFPDGTVKEGRTGRAGKAWVPGPKEGTVKVSFPGIDGGSWRPA